MINLASLKFKYADETAVYKPLIDAVNKLCADKGKDCLCTSGYRSLEKQKIINTDSLRSHAGAYQLYNGAVYTKDGKCWAAAYGKSNHCFCIALDITDNWFKALSNKELIPYGLIKPIDYEPWHVQLLEHQGINEEQKNQIRDSVLNNRKDDENVTVTEFQEAFGLTADGVVGDKTKAKLTEVLQFCQEQLRINYSTAEEAIKNSMSKPTIWLAMLKTVPYFKDFVMNIIKKTGGRA